VDRRTFTLGIACFVTMLASGCKANPPTRTEQTLMTAVKRHIFVRNKSERNPIRSTAASVHEGREAFSHYCAACHGLDGQNTGVPFAERMSPPVPRLSSAEVQSYTDGQLKWVIDYGVSPSGMPGSRGILSDEEIWSIVVYLRHLPPAGSLGEPAMYTH
jgi:cytochrome c553